MSEYTNHKVNPLNVQQLEERETTTDMGRVALAIEHLAQSVDYLAHTVNKVAYGATEYPGAIEHISMCIKEGAENISNSLDNIARATDE